MTADPTDFDPTAPPTPAAVGAYVVGPPDGPRQVVRWADQLRDHHELAEHVDPDAEAYLSGFCYPAAPYVAHFKACGKSPRGYSGPAGCAFLLFDVDRAGDPDAALADSRKLVHFLLDCYGLKLEDGIAVYWSGGKGFHILLECLPASVSTPTVPMTCKRLALAIATKAGVRIDTAVYDHQRLVRMPNSRHPRTGLYKRFLTHEELFALDAAEIRDLALYPAGFPVPRAGEYCQELQDDFDRAAADAPPSRGSTPQLGYPLVPAFVRDFIGFADVQDPGRAMTLFRAAAALAEAGTPDIVVAGLLEEPALKTGIEPWEVAKQIRDGIACGRRAGGLLA